MPSRLSCDRCHQQKLRCIKNAAGHASCNRCLTMGAECKFSPSMRGVRPHRPKGIRGPGSARPLTHEGPEDPMSSAAFLWKSPITTALAASDERPQPQFSNGADDLGFFDTNVSNGDAIAFSLDQLEDGVGTNVADGDGYTIGAYSTAEPISPPQIHELTEPPEPPDQENTVLALEHSIGQLSQRLCNHAAKIPPLSVWSRNLSGATAARCPSETLDFHLDETFSLSEVVIAKGYRFTDLLREYRHWSQSESTPSDRNDRSMTDPSLPWLYTADQGLDLASFHLLLSCHYRILDIWTITFIHIRNCARTSLEKSTEATVMHVPKVRMGSFTPSTSAALDIHLSMMARTGTQIEAAVQALLDEMSAPSGRGRGTSPAASSSIAAPSAWSGLFSIDDVVDRIGGEGLRCPAAVSSCRALLEKAGDMVRNVETIRKLIEQALARSGAVLLHG